MSNQAQTALQNFHNKDADVFEKTHYVPQVEPAGTFCSHAHQEPLYRTARPYPVPVTKQALSVTLVATWCPDCSLLAWRDVDRIDGS